jgi:predicted O-methyltransferase YrrM
MNKPWLPYLVTDYIKQLNPKRVFEWGSGESTLFFTNELNALLVSVEHDGNFYDKMIDTLAKEKILSAYHFIPHERGEIGPDKANPLHYKSGSTNLGDVNFKKYASVIDEYGLFDLILIDGMARVSCLHHAFNHVAPGGCIVLDNTGDRPYYLKQTEAMFGNYETGWEKVTMMGYGPILDYKWETTIFINRSKADYE